MSKCTLCPRACGADRAAGQRGRCHETDTVRIARASLHLWEEPCLSGTNGAGTVFFTGCPLGCVYCQNYT
ncbi:MAG: radical SAM protein, partial [Clostridia bacterium]|nr:radical SAM protein [Clostridia bacterium]